MGIKSLERNFNPKARTYNPHFHLIVPNTKVANLLMAEWQIQWNRKGKRLARPFAQHQRRVKNLEADRIKTIKYGSKIFTEPDKKQHRRLNTPLKVYAAALDNILSAFEGHRLFDRFGFNQPKEQTDPLPAQFLNQYEEWLYDRTVNDWVNPDSGELLSGFVPSGQLIHLLNDIDTARS